MTVECPYCGKVARLTTGKRVYPHRNDLHHKLFYQCEPCDAYVGCHPDTKAPLGTPANAELRAARSGAHNAFDQIWKSGAMSRSAAYKWLREQMGLTSEQCHIGLFDLELCCKVQEVCSRGMFE